MNAEQKETVERIAENLRFLFRRTGLEIQEISTRSGVGQRTINSMKAGVGNPTIANVDAVARAFRLGLTGWHLLSRSLEREFMNRDFLGRISQAYADTSKAGQDVLNKALDIAESLRPPEPPPEEQPAPPAISAPKLEPVADEVEEARKRIRNRKPKRPPGDEVPTRKAR
jgi:transcriptional regulator with XRE-family HTH domain